MTEIERLFNEYIDDTDIPNMSAIGLFEYAYNKGKESIKEIKTINNNLNN